MIDHTGFSVSDFDRSRQFYNAALEPLDLALVTEVTPEQSGAGAHAGYGSEGKAFFWIGDQGPAPTKHHVAFVAPSRTAVDAFYSAALAAGGKDNGAPGVRAHFSPDYYAAFVLDPDGVNIEAVCRQTSLVESKAVGRFEVTLTPNSAPDAPIGAMAISKTFHGDLEGTSAGQMLAFGTAVPGSAGYVAMEKVVASLAGKHGTFVFQHSGSMNKGRPSLLVTIVPDSGTDGLTGLTGSMEIKKEAGQHAYTIRYSLP